MAWRAAAGPGLAGDPAGGVSGWWAGRGGDRPTELSQAAEHAARENPSAAAVRSARGVRRGLRAVRRLARDLSGGSDRVLVELVSRQVRSAQHGIELASRLAAGQLAPAHARAAMACVEHDGDGHRAALIGSLRRSLTSPIDREDLFRLSRRIDDVLDVVRDFVREFDLFGALPDEVYAPVLDALAGGLARLDEAVRLLPAQPRAAAETALGAKKQGVRPAYQRAVGELLSGAVDGRVAPSPVSPVLASPAQVSPALVARCLLLHRLDLAGERCSAAADALADGVMKRFQ